MSGIVKINISVDNLQEFKKWIYGKIRPKLMLEIIIIFVVFIIFGFIMTIFFQYKSYKNQIENLTLENNSLKEAVKNIKSSYYLVIDSYEKRLENINKGFAVNKKESNYEFMHPDSLYNFYQYTLSQDDSILFIVLPIEKKSFEKWIRSNPATPWLPYISPPKPGEPSDISP